MSSARYISLLMSSRNQAHTFHLVTTSFAMHKALQDYYEGIVPLLDQWAEAYIHYGLYGITPLSDNLFVYGGLSAITSACGRQR